jgi:hypothetical protein
MTVMMVVLIGTINGLKGHINRNRLKPKVANHPVNHVISCIPDDRTLKLHGEMPITQVVNHRQ